jgi:hypothetical protein
LLSHVKRRIDIRIVSRRSNRAQADPATASPEPTIRFFGGRDQGFKALWIALANGLRPAALRCYYSIQDGEPVGPDWEMTFTKPDLPNWYAWSRAANA